MAQRSEGLSRKPLNVLRILVLSIHYAPETNFITTDVARALTAIGHVTVVTAHPNYPLGHFYPGVRPWRPRRTVEDGVVVWRVPFFPTRSTSVVRRGLSYLSFTLAAAITAATVAGRTDIVWVYHGPFTTGLAALWFRIRKRVKIVITAADLWPESLAASNVMRDSIIMRALYRYSRFINRAADLIICATRGTLDRYRRDGVPPERLTVVPVWVDGIPDHPASVIDHPKSSPTLRVIYAGNLGPAQAVDVVIRAAAVLRDSDPDIHFDLYGRGASEASLKILAEELQATNVAFLGRVSPDEAFRVSASAFVQIVSLRPTPLFRMTIPSKLAFAIAAGAPIVYGLEGEAGAIAAESGLGVPFDPVSPESLANAIRSVRSLSVADRQSMRVRARAYHLNQFSRHRLLERYVSLFTQLADHCTVQS